MTDLPLIRTVKSRKSHAAKSGMDTRAAKTLVGALFGKGVEFFEDEDGNLIREWTREESYHWTFEDLRSVLRNRVAVEPGEIIGSVPPSAVKYCTGKGWFKKHPTAELYFITARCARELDLPVKFKGGQHHGRKIPFVA
jgi:hypothetical protein